MRVTGGKFKGRIIPSFQWKGTRPTQDKIRSAIFDILGPNFNFTSLAVLDLYAGSGIVALEFLSRGAISVTSVDTNYKCIKFINGLKDVFGVKNWSAQKQNVDSFLRTNKNSFDIIFADPPYNLKDSRDQINRILTTSIIKKQGLLIWEHRSNESFQDLHENIKVKTYGDTSLTFFYF